MIEVADLYKSFGDAAVLQGASFSAAPGTATARIDRTDVTTDRTAAQERLAFLPQDVRFHDALTLRQVLRFYAGLRDAPDARLDALLDDVGLADAAQKSCGALSGGMRQRLGIAVFELARAPVLLLDEPGLSLDPKWRGFLMDRLRARVEEGAAVLMATHLLDVWRPLADRVLRCEGGTVREVELTTGAVASVDENASAV
ncbi:ATP-binding cassette domain-containing protein [Salinibacter ruber]|uniref:ATP-binding cassette domain-containing protein n=1 Tax=Salinibacter ruber TaxID=146919 RepID=UPI000C9F7519|nr:ABC transporter ATP-binding protein [Salinibacter ruber]MCS3610134.1 ABC-type multidrug transport system ATPase subunit [Salinibacter ruber]MCS3647807.1 ABC-type multidrug transport system ATPase subunit [Salinibacter ruber]